MYHVCRCNHKLDILPSGLPASEKYPPALLRQRYPKHHKLVVIIQSRVERLPIKHALRTDKVVVRLPQPCQLLAQQSHPQTHRTIKNAGRLPEACHRDTRTLAKICTRPGHMFPPSRAR